MDILNFKIADDADEKSVRFESPDRQRYKAKEMLILSYLQIHTPAAVKFYGEESPLLHDMMQIITDSAIAVINDSDNVKCYRELCENILQTDYPDKKAAADELHNICQTLLLG